MWLVKMVVFILAWICRRKHSYEVAYLCSLRLLFGIPNFPVARERKTVTSSSEMDTSIITGQTIHLCSNSLPSPLMQTNKLRLPLNLLSESELAHLFNSNDTANNVAISFFNNTKRFYYKTNYAAPFEGRNRNKKNRRITLKFGSKMKE